MRGRRGFTLLEVIVVIAVISILASIAVPYAAQILNQTREQNARNEMEELHGAIMGNPSVPTSGFVGDMGRLPANLTQLNVRGGQPVGTNGLLGVKIGWFGPYINTGFDANGYLNDPWGIQYAYGNPGAGQIRSAGKDRTMGTADDIIYPPNPATIGGSLLVNLSAWHTDNTASQYILNPQPAAFPGMTATVTFNYSSNGIQTGANVGTPAGPPYVFGIPVGFHAGFHAVTAVCTIPPDPPVTGQAVVYVPGNGQQAQLNLYLR
ncbi:MAG: prepilin-type N-terminal cleavage/methylation domain-containing protein [Candidatus Deferrimicrobiaceae bacterium]